MNNLNLLIIERFLLEFDDKESEQEALDSEVNNNAESPSLYQKSLEKLKLLTASSERLDKVAGPELDNTEALAQAQEEASSFYQKPFVALRNYGSSVITSYRSAQDLPWACDRYASVIKSHHKFMLASYMKQIAKFLALLHHNASFLNFCIII